MTESSSKCSESFPGGYQFMFTDEFVQSCSKDDLVVALFHFFSVNAGLKCGTKSTLASDWNTNTEPYVLNYDSYNGASIDFTCKVLKVGDDTLMFHVSYRESVQSAEVKISDVVEENHSPDCLFKNMHILNESFSHLLSCLKSTTSTSVGTNTSQQPQNIPTSDYRPAFLLGERPMPPSVGSYPFDYGRADLNPSMPPGPGGMIFPMPQRDIHPSNIEPYGPEPGRLPYGAVPPNARFDPFTPGADPTRFGPEPDHMRMPGSRNNFDRFI